MNLILTQPNPSWTIDQLRRHFGMIPAECAFCSTRRRARPPRKM